MEEQWVGGEGGRKQETTPLWTLGAGTTVFYIDGLDKEGARDNIAAEKNYNITFFLHFLYFCLFFFFHKKAVKY